MRNFLSINDMYKYIPLTLTFKDDLNYNTGVRHFLKRVFRLEDKNIKYNFCPEIGSNYKFHLHGYIEYRNDEIVTVQRFLSIWKRYEGFYYISKLTDIVKWHIYCHKDYWIHKTQYNNQTTYKKRTQLETLKCHYKQQGIWKYLDK